MDFDEYQERSSKTNIYEKAIDDLLYPIESALRPSESRRAWHSLHRVRQILNWYYVILGLVGEAGELANKAKKITRDRYPRITDDHDAELGDVMWYIAQAAVQRNKNLSEYAEDNLNKLSSRQERNVLSGDGDHR